MYLNHRVKHYVLARLTNMSFFQLLTTPGTIAIQRDVTKIAVPAGGGEGKGGKLGNGALPSAGAGAASAKRAGAGSIARQGSGASGGAAKGSGAAPSRGPPRGKGSGPRDPAAEQREAQLLEESLVSSLKPNPNPMIKPETQTLRPKP